MKVCVVGAGNIGSILLNDLSRNDDLDVVALVRNRKKIKKHIDKKVGNSVIKGKPISVTEEPQIAFENANIVFFTLPSDIMHQKKDFYFPYINSGTNVIFIPGTGGMEFISPCLVKKQVKIFGLQRVHAISRVIEYGSLVEELDRKNELQLATINGTIEELNYINNFLQSNLEIKTTNLPNYLCVTLTPSNPILHTTRLYDLFGDDIDMTFDRMILFYKEWTDRSSKYLLKADSEFDELIEKISSENIKISGLNNLKNHYEVKNEEEVTRKIKSIKSFSQIESPLISKDNQFKADFQSRYFTEDFEYGLSFLFIYANYFASDCQFMKEMLNWYQIKINPQFKITVSDNDVEEVIEMMNL